MSPTITVRHESGEVDLMIRGVDPIGPAAVTHLNELRAAVYARIARLNDLPEVQACMRLETERARAVSRFAQITAAVETLKIELSGAIGDDARVAILTSQIARHEADAKGLALVLEACDLRLPAAERDRASATSEALRSVLGDERRTLAASAAELAAKLWKAAGPMVARLEGMAMLDHELMGFWSADPMALVAQARRKLGSTTN